jgi:general secretion pathway protein C
MIELRRLPGGINPPLLLSLVLGVLIIVELGRAWVLLAGGHPARLDEPARVQSTAVPKRPSVDVQDIVAAHLFGVLVEDTNSQDPARARPTTANLLLAGTIATDDPKDGLAIIRDTGPERVYKVGDSVGGASLHSVYLDHVILNRSGTLESLVLPRLLLARGRFVDRGAPASSTTESSEPESSAATKSPTTADVMRTGLSTGADGKLRGFRVFPSGNRTAFDKSGLRPGDLVVAVNGTSLQDQDRRAAGDILNTMNSSSQATVTIERNGRRQDVTVTAPQPDE